MQVLLVQMDLDYTNPPSNLKKVKTILENYEKKDKNTLVVLPELFLTGYHPESIKSVGNNLFQSEYISDLIEIAGLKNLTIYGSFPELENGDYFNTGVLLDGSRVKASYRKSHLFRPMDEDKLFSPGRSIVVDDETKFGLSICYDLRFSELYLEQAKKGAKILIVVAEWPISRINHWLALLKARAIENQCFVIGVNRVGTDLFEFGGHSTIFDPFGDIVGGFDHANEENGLFEIDLGKIDEFKNKFDTNEDRWIN